MRFLKKYELWRACDRDGLRPVLEHIDVTELHGPIAEIVRGRLHAAADARVGVAVAADGFLLAAVPVWLDDDDVLGLVPWEAWKAAKRDKDGVCHLALGEASVTTDEGTTFARMTNAGKFPDWRRVVKYAPVAKRTRETIALNPRLLAVVGKALGLSDYGGLGISWGRKYSDVLVLDAYKPQADGTPVPPFGALMPMVPNDVWGSA